MTTTALPAPALEAWRLRAIHELRSTFTELCEPFLAEGTRNAARRERTMCKAFETWLFSCRSAAMSDDWERRALPIVPGMPAAGHDEALRRKLCLAGATAVQAEGVLDKLSTAATKLAVVAEHVPETVAGSIVESNCKDGMVTLVCAQQSVRCTSHHLVKLWALHQAAKRESKPCAVQWVRPRSGSCCPSVDPRVKAILANRQFVTAVYCVLARYLSLQGGSRRGGRMQVRHATGVWLLPRAVTYLYQAALPPACFRVLQQFGVSMECFASPLNCHFSRFCSAFADTDSAFGSVGSFFEFMPTSGLYEANPPFEKVLRSKLLALPVSTR